MILRTVIGVIVGVGGVVANFARFVIVVRVIVNLLAADRSPEGDASEQCDDELADAADENEVVEGGCEQKLQHVQIVHQDGDGAESTADKNREQLFDVVVAQVRPVIVGVIEAGTLGQGGVGDVVHCKSS